MTMPTRVPAEAPILRLNQALPLLIDMMADANPHVKDTTAWTLGRICDLLVGTIKPDVHLHPLIASLVNGLQDNPRIIANCCWALLNLSEAFGQSASDDAVSSPAILARFYDPVIAALLQVTARYRAASAQFISVLTSSHPLQTLE